MGGLFSFTTAEDKLSSNMLRLNESSLRKYALQL